MDARTGVWQLQRLLVRYCKHSVGIPLPWILLQNPETGPSFISLMNAGKYLCSEACPWHLLFENAKPSEMDSNITIPHVLTDILCIPLAG
jgi:hypothetical protein